MSPEEILDRRWMRAAFERAAPGYDRVADLQREVTDRTLERLDFVRLDPPRVLDLGAGTGYGMRALGARYPRAEVHGLDIAQGMLREARRQALPGILERSLYVCGDALRLPLGNDAFPLVFSSLTLQWCEDLPSALAEIWRVCAPGGLVLFSSLGPDTLGELRDAWAGADGGSHVNRFLDMHLVGDALMATGFRDVVTDVDRMTWFYPGVVGLMQSLKSLGAHNVRRDRPRHLTPPSRLESVQRRYEALRRPEGLPATYEVVYAHAWKPAVPVPGVAPAFGGAPP